jgi:hypothetical protein
MVLFRTAYTLGIEPFSLAMQAMKMRNKRMQQLLSISIFDHSFVFFAFLDLLKQPLVPNQVIGCYKSGAVNCYC